MAEPSGNVLGVRIRDAAKLLGISSRTLWQLTRDGVVPHVRLGKGKRKAIIYPVDELKAWLSQQTVRPAQQPEGGAE